MGKAAPLASASAEPSCGPWVPALATLGRDTRTVRMADTLPNGRAEARARPGHERVAADAMALEPLADAPPASFPLHNVKQRSLLSFPGHFCLRVLLLASFPFVAADPRARGLAERPETSSLVRVAVTRDATDRK